MELGVTLGTFAALAGGAVLCGWAGARPSDPLRGPRLVPWGVLMVTLAFGAILALVHAANLLGVVTGQGAGPVR